jgi:heme exporter protein B
MNSTFILFCRREWQLLFRNTANLVQPLCFFVIITLLFPFSLPLENELLSRIGGGVIWVSAVLAILMSLDAMFKADYNDGALEQWLMHPRSLPIAMLAKVFIHWVATGLLLTLFSPVLSMAFRIPTDQIWVLFIGLLLGTPSLSLIGAIGAALTVSLHRGGVLLAVIILPLYIPILIFGAGMITQSSLGASIDSQVYALIAILTLAITLTPFAIAGALRITIE